MDYPNAQVYLVRRPKLNGLGWHEGVLVQSLLGDVVYDKSFGGIRAVSPEVFAAGRDVDVLSRSPSGHLALERLEAAIAEAREYLPWGDNCQHFARWVAFGKAESPTVQIVGWTLALTWLLGSAEAA